MTDIGELTEDFIMDTLEVTVFDIDENSGFTVDGEEDFWNVIDDSNLDDIVKFFPEFDDPYEYGDE